MAYERRDARSLRRAGALLLGSLVSLCAACASSPTSSSDRPPSAEQTSDRGDRLLVPSPVGQMAPELPPAPRRN